MKRVSWLVAAALPLVGAQYFVATNGSDSAAGTQAAPWRTLTKAASTVQAGDTVWVRGGDYAGEGQIYIGTRAGTPAAPITFSAYPGERPVARGVEFNTVSNYVIIGFTFTNRAFRIPHTWQPMPATVVDDPTVVIDPNESWTTRQKKVGRKYSTYTNIFYQLDYDTSWIDLISMQRCQNMRLYSNTFWGATAGIYMRRQCRNVEVAYNYFYQCLCGLLTYGQSGEGFTVRDARIVSNTFRQMFSTGLSFTHGACSNLIAYNDSRYSALDHFALHHYASNNVVRNNIGMYGGFYSETMEYPGSSAFNAHYAGPGNVFDGNFAAYQYDPTLNDGNGFIADMMYNNWGVTFINNVVWRNTRGFALTESPNCRIINNTIAESGWTTNLTFHVGAAILFSKSKDTNNVVVNNIFYENNIGLDGYQLMPKQKKIDYNLYYSSSGKPFMWNGWETNEACYYSVAQIQAATVWEDHGVQGNPVFDGGGFMLSDTSPAISAASAADAPPHDYFGLLRDAQPDIGAYEYIPEPLAAGLLPLAIILRRGRRIFA